eukprot:scaffold88288_cov36-Phaeocystis_antarctica.AAC.1
MVAAVALRARRRFRSDPICSDPIRSVPFRSGRPSGCPLEVPRERNSSTARRPEAEKAWP